MHNLSDLSSGPHRKGSREPSVDHSSGTFLSRFGSIKNASKKQPSSHTRKKAASGPVDLNSARTVPLSSTRKTRSDNGDAFSRFSLAKLSKRKDSFETPSDKSPLAEAPSMSLRGHRTSSGRSHGSPSPTPSPSNSARSSPRVHRSPKSSPRIPSYNRRKTPPSKQPPPVDEESSRLVERPPLDLSQALPPIDTVKSRAFPNAPPALVDVSPYLCPASKPEIGFTLTPSSSTSTSQCTTTTSTSATTAITTEMIGRGLPSIFASAREKASSGTHQDASTGFFMASECESVKGQEEDVDHEAVACLFTSLLKFPRLRRESRKSLCLDPFNYMPSYSTTAHTPEIRVISRNMYSFIVTFFKDFKHYLRPVKEQLTDYFGSWVVGNLVARRSFIAAKEGSNVDFKATPRTRSHENSWSHFDLFVTFFSEKEFSFQSSRANSRKFAIVSLMMLEYFRVLMECILPKVMHYGGNLSDRPDISLRKVCLYHMLNLMARTEQSLTTEDTGLNQRHNYERIKYFNLMVIIYWPSLEAHYEFLFEMYAHILDDTHASMSLHDSPFMGMLLDDISMFYQRLSLPCKSLTELMLCGPLRMEDYIIKRIDKAYLAHYDQRFKPTSILLPANLHSHQYLTLAGFDQQSCILSALESLPTALCETPDLDWAEMRNLLTEGYLTTKTLCSSRLPLLRWFGFNENASSTAAMDEEKEDRRSHSAREFCQKLDALYEVLAAKYLEDEPDYLGQDSQFRMMRDPFMTTMTEAKDDGVQLEALLQDYVQARVALQRECLYWDMDIISFDRANFMSLVRETIDGQKHNQPHVPTMQTTNTEFQRFF